MDVLDSVPRTAGKNLMCPRCVPALSWLRTYLHFLGGRCLGRNLLASRSWVFGRADSSDAVKGSFRSPSHQLSHDAAPTGFWAGSAFERQQLPWRPAIQLLGRLPWSRLRVQKDATRKEPKVDQSRLSFVRTLKGQVVEPHHLMPRLVVPCQGQNAQ